MTDTITNMELVYADLLSPDQLMDGDLISIDGSIVEVMSVNDDANGDNYVIEYRNDYGEDDEYSCTYEEQFKLYVFVESTDE